MIEPGIYKGIPFDEYTKIDALNASTIVNFLKTPDSALVSITPTPAMKFGTNFHTFLLEPHLFDFDSVSAKDASLMQDMNDSLNSGKYETARKLIEGAEKEQTVVWDHIKHGLRCKARLDLVNIDLGIVADIKTTGGSVDPDAWLVGAMKYTLPFIQVSWYLQAAKEAYPDVDFKTFLWVLFSNKPPYGITILDATRSEDGSDIILAYSRIIDAMIPDYLDCKRKKVWPGMDDRVVPCNVPPWAWKDLEKSKYYG
jgi:hypothetical protein